VRGWELSCGDESILGERTGAKYSKDIGAQLGEGM